MYKEKKMFLEYPVEGITKEQVLLINKILDDTFKEMMDVSSIKSFKVDINKKVTERNGVPINIYSISGFFIEEMVNSLLNVLKYIADNLNGEVRLNLEKIDNDIYWDIEMNNNFLLNILGVNKKIKRDISNHKSVYLNFCDKLNE